MHERLTMEYHSKRTETRAVSFANPYLIFVDESGAYPRRVQLEPLTSETQASEEYTPADDPFNVCQKTQ